MNILKSVSNASRWLSRFFFFWVPEYDGVSPELDDNGRPLDYFDNKPFHADRDIGFKPPPVGYRPGLNIPVEKKSKAPPFHVEVSSAAHGVIVDRADGTVVLGLKSHGYRDVMWCPSVDEPVFVAWDESECMATCPMCHDQYSLSTHPFIVHIGPVELQS